MGTDLHPAPDVAGAVLAARQYGCDIVLVGDRELVEQALNQHDTVGLHIDVRHTDEAVTMDDPPAAVGKSKPNSTMHIGMRLVKEGEADAFVTAGNTGAALAIATVYTLRRIRGVKRPALAAVYPFHGDMVTILDVGANTDCKPDWLAQFAMMGSVYANRVLGIDAPGVGLMSTLMPHNEPPVIAQTDALLQQLPINYLGRINPPQTTREDVHVVVTDGFLGNLLMKTYEASLRHTARNLRSALRRSPRAIVGGLLIQPGLQRIRREIDPTTIGGAPLLGVDGVVIVAHGSSNDVAVKNAVGQAIRAVEGHLVDLIKDGMRDVAAIGQPDV